MDGAQPRLIDVRAERGANNALRLVFRDGPGEPFATARQEAGGGVGRKLGVLFGFKNGGTGTHELTVGARSLGVVSKDGQPTDITDGVGGDVLARVERGATSSAVAADGRPLLTFVARGPEPKTPDLFCLDVQAPDGTRVATLDVVRRASGWTLARTLDVVTSDMLFYWWDHAGKALPFPLLGARLVLDAPLDGTALDVLLAACVDIVIGLRPYVGEMA